MLRIYTSASSADASAPDGVRIAIGVARAAGLFAVFVGCSVFLGWIVDSPLLKGAIGKPITIKTNTGICFVALGASLLLSLSTSPGRLRGSQLLAFLAAVIGGLTLSQHVMGWDLGIDQLLFREPPGVAATSSPNRMGPPAAISFVLIGLSLLLLDQPKPNRTFSFRYIPLVAIVIPLISIVGYAFSSPELYSTVRRTEIAWPTAVTLLALNLGVLAARPENVIVRLLAASDAGGDVARRLLLPALLIPFFLLLAYAGLRDSRWIDADAGRALLAVVMMVALTSVVMYTAYRLSVTAQLGEAAERERRAADERANEQRELLLTTLAEADRRKNEFLAMLAHELRNPLAPLRNAVQLLRMSGGEGETSQAALEMMERQIGQVVRLIDDLLDVNRISRGTIELRKERIELAPVVHSAVEAARPICDGMQHALTVSLPQAPIHLDADPTRLAQVIGNLLNNACKFTEQGGRIRLAVNREGSEAVIRVADNGLGIAADQLARIFEMFTQVDTSLERTQGGLGIGLTLVKTIVEMHDGRVEVHSAGIGQGSEFVVRIPALAELPPPAPKEKPTNSASSTPRRVLVVDDNHDAASSMARLLELRGHEVHVAHDGLEAVEATAAVRPDVILLDIGLPNLNGYEAAQRIRALPMGAGVVLVALTGWGQEEDRQRSKAAGFDAHLVKPVDHDALAAILANLDGHADMRGNR